ncbi:hypothetical protein [Priestia flexa]|uniref:hypothetical protein n=1 Tax=Priestia flexa TaxID=86664 RepID=UPI001F4CC078|nr:hypothetical protein [Priestia flexa]
MPDWLIIELTVGIIWLIVLAVVQRVKLWKITFPFSYNTGFSLLILIVFPIAWLATLILIGIYYFIKSNSIHEGSLVLPLLLFIYILFRFIQYKKNKASNYYTNQELLKKKQECIEWLQKCNFWDERYLNIQVYKIKSKVIGKVTVNPLNEEQYLCLKNMEKILPENVHLFILKD